MASHIELNDTVDPADFNDGVKAQRAAALDPNHVTRQEAARRACESIGIVWPETILPPGTALYTSGVETLKSDRKRWAMKPFAAQALPAVIAALAAEDRRDFEVPIAALRLDPKTAKIVREADIGKRPGLGYDESAFTQLCARVPALSTEAPRSHSKNLLYLDADIRACQVNRRIHDAAESLGSKTALIRTKLSTNGQRVARAVLSERYADVSDLHVASSLEAALMGDTKSARLDYRPGDQHSQFEVIYPSEIPVPLFKVGDVHKAVILIDNSETGHGSIRVRPGVVRAACANLTLSHGFGVEVNIRHIGNEERVRGQLRAAIAQAAAQVEPLVAAIVASTKVEAPAGKTPGELFGMLAKKFAVTTTVAKEWTQTFEAKYQQFGSNLWSVTSAITDAAQKATNWWEQQQQEEVAAELLAKQFVSVLR